jgi:hypothetical protein
VLSSREEQVWDDVVRFWTEDAEEPTRPAAPGARPTSQGEAGLPVAVVVGARIAIVLVLFGFVAAGLALALATALAWAVRRPRPGCCVQPTVD